MAGQRKAAPHIFEHIAKLNKEELLELLRHPQLFFAMERLRPHDLDVAKGKVVRRKAAAALKKWEEFGDVPLPAKNAGHVAVARFYLKTAEREAHFTRYMRLSDQADRLEFGH